MAATEQALKSDRVPGAEDAPVQSRNWETRFDQGRYPRAKLGFVLISSEQVADGDIYKLAAPGVGVHFTRVRMQPDVTVENLHAMAGDLASASSVLVPEERLDAICYVCTSGAAVIGEERCREELLRGRPAFNKDCKATTLVSCVVEGLRAVDARKIVIGTPYPDPVNTKMAAFMRSRGFDVLYTEGLNLKDDTEITRVDPAFILEFARAIDHRDADAIFLSCGGFRAVDVIAEIEKAIGKPVISSNQAMAWHCQRLAGISDKIEGFGRLFQEC